MFTIICAFPLTAEKVFCRMKNTELIMSIPEPGPELMRQVEEGARIVRSGGVIAFPTDTVYGLGADVLQEEAVKRIYRIKQRPLNIPLPVLLAEREQVPIVASYIPEIAYVLMNHFWPGGLTLVLPAVKSFRSRVVAGGETVAVRIPDHKVTLALIRAVGQPLVGTSANVYNHPNARTAEEVRRQLADRIDYIIDGGTCPGGMESTVVDVTGAIPIILRQGAVPVEQIMTFYGKKE